MTIQPTQRCSLAPTAALFMAGALITAGFSASLYMLTQGVSFAHVLLIGMIVPSLTWLIHLFAAWFFLPRQARLAYCRALGIVCLIGSLALLPAAVVNVAFANPPGWLSAANVLLSVFLMAAVLWRFSVAQSRSRFWPISWCITITGNMGLFVGISSHWWR